MPAPPVVFLLAALPAVGLGLARFGYALVVPDMADDLAWSYAEAGWPNAANAAGYLGGALLMGVWSGPWRTPRALAGGLVVTLASVAAVALCRDLLLLSAVRFVSGLFAATTFIGGMALVAHLPARSEHAAARHLGLFCSGAGFGIVLSTAVLPLLAGAPAAAWPRAWLLLAALGTPLLVGGLLGLGRAEAPAAAPGPAPGQGGGARGMAALLVAYLVFGAGYIGYMTFTIAWLGAAGIGPLGQALFWAVLGLACMVSPFAWSGLIGRGQGGRPVATLILLTGLATALPLVSPALPMLLLSGALFGASFFAVVSAVAHFVRSAVPPERRASVFGLATLAFGVGQTVGPVATGMISDATGALDGGLAASAGLLLVGAACAWLQPEPDRATLAAAPTAGR